MVILSPLAVHKFTFLTAAKFGNIEICVTDVSISTRYTHMLQVATLSCFRVQGKEKTHYDEPVGKI
jgi:hypothetical protein